MVAFDIIFIFVFQASSVPFPHNLVPKWLLAFDDPKNYAQASGWWGESRSDCTTSDCHRDLEVIMIISVYTRPSQMIQLFKVKRIFTMGWGSNWNLREEVLPVLLDFGTPKSSFPIYSVVFHEVDDYDMMKLGFSMKTTNALLIWGYKMIECHWRQQMQHAGMCPLPFGNLRLPRRCGRGCCRCWTWPRWLLCQVRPSELKRVFISFCVD